MQMTYPMHLTPPSPPVLPYGSPRTSSSPETAPPPARVSQFPHRHLPKYLPPPHHPPPSRPPLSGAPSAPSPASSNEASPSPPPQPSPPSFPQTLKWFPTS